MSVPMSSLFLSFALLLPTYDQDETYLSQGEHYVTVRGVRLWYLVRGHGPVLLFQPGGAGWGGDATPYIETLRPLEQRNTVVYLEPRGIGRSERLHDSGGYSMEEYVQDIEAIRRRFKLSKIAVAGHSHGGFVALKYAIRYGDKTDRLLLLSVAPSLQPDLNLTWMKRRKGYRRAVHATKLLDAKKMIPEEKWRAWLRIWLPVLHFSDYEKVSKQLDAILDRTSISLGPYEYFMDNEADTYDVRESLGSVLPPTLIVVGDDDMRDTLMGSRLLQARIPNSVLAIIANCGHWPMLEKPEELFRVAIPFLAASAGEDQASMVNVGSEATRPVSSPEFADVRAGFAWEMHRLEFH